MFTFMREPLNSLTHMAGLILSALGLIVLLSRAGGATALAAALIFGLGLMGLYGASTVYHWVQGPPAVVSRLRMLDHIMIYILIAATYTPVCLIPLRHSGGIPLLITIWSLALGGSILKVLWKKAPRLVYTGLYLGLGWAAVVVIRPLALALPMAAVVLLIAGGLAYSAGAVIYGLKPARMKLGPFRYHEIFHLFILLGSLLHFLMIWQYVL